MNTTTIYSVAKILIIKNAHPDYLAVSQTERDILRHLGTNNFVLTNTSPDAFIETYENNDFTNENIKTLVFIDNTGNRSGYLYTLVNPTAPY